MEREIRVVGEGYMKERFLERQSGRVRKLRIDRSCRVRWRG